MVKLQTRSRRTRRNQKPRRTRRGPKKRGGYRFVRSRKAPKNRKWSPKEQGMSREVRNLQKSIRKLVAGRGPGIAETMFAAIDSDGNGNISPSEFRKFLLQD